jgi:hypothetical protein
MAHLNDKAMSEPQDGLTESEFKTEDSTKIEQP